MITRVSVNGLTVWGFYVSPRVRGPSQTKEPNKLNQRRTCLLKAFCPFTSLTYPLKYQERDQHNTCGHTGHLHVRCKRPLHCRKLHFAYVTILSRGKFAVVNFHRYVTKMTISAHNISFNSFQPTLACYHVIVITAFSQC